MRAFCIARVLVMTMKQSIALLKQELSYRK